MDQETADELDHYYNHWLAACAKVEALQRTLARHRAFRDKASYHVPALLGPVGSREWDQAEKWWREASAVISHGDIP